MQPWVRAAVTPMMASYLQWFHPARYSRVVWSERVTPAMALVESTARLVRENRAPSGEDNALRQYERTTADLMQQSIEAWRKIRDAYAEAVREGYLWHEFGDSHLLLPQAA